MGGHHYAAWLWDTHPEDVPGFAGVLSAEGGGDTGAPEVRHNPVPREHYHTDWIAERADAWLRRATAGRPFFLWVSFPDPHHPFDPPASELRRVPWRELELPPGHPGSPDAIRKSLGTRPRHWLDWYEGRFRNPEGGSIAFSPGKLTHDQVREVNAAIHVENELIDEAVGRLLASLAELGVDDDTDVFYTSDHGELQGDHGLMCKGPYHVTSLLHVPMLWRPAPSAGIAAADIPEPVGHVDLAPTFCEVAGIPVPAHMEGASLPTLPGSRRRAVITTFDSQFAPMGMHLRTIFAEDTLCTVYEPSTRDEGGRFPLYWSVWGRGTVVPRYDGSEGELYDLRDDPLQRHSRFHDPALRARRDRLIEELRALLPPLARRLPVSAPT